MPLSEHEQRLLEQIEQSLYADDPKFARSWRTRDPGSLRRHRLLRAALVFVLGLVALLAGVIVLNRSSLLGIVLGVAGFLLMLGAAWYALSTRQRLRSVAVPEVGEGPAGRARAPRGKNKKQRAPRGQRGRGGPHQSLSERLQERWERRQDDRGGF